MYEKVCMESGYRTDVVSLLWTKKYFGRRGYSVGKKVT